MRITQAMIERTARALVAVDNEVMSKKRGFVDLRFDELDDLTRDLFLGYARWHLERMRDERRKMLARFGRMSIGEILSEIGKREAVRTVVGDLLKGFEP